MIVLTTKNGGHTWSSIYRSSALYAPPAHIECPSAHAYITVASNNGEVSAFWIKTKDGGEDVDRSHTFTKPYIPQLPGNSLYIMDRSGGNRKAKVYNLVNRNWYRSRICHQLKKIDGHEKARAFIPIIEWMPVSDAA